MPDKYDKFMDGMDAEAANTNLAGAQGIAPQSAVRAFKSAPSTGVDPSLGMVAPDEGDALAGYDRDTSALSNPSVARFAAKSPAHVAATREDWGTLGKIGILADAIGPAQEAAGELVRNYKAFQAAGQERGLITGRDAASLKLLWGAVNFLPTAILGGAANVAARPLSYIPRPEVRREGLGLRPTGGMMTQPEAQRAIAGELLTAAAGYGAGKSIRVPRPPVTDLGTAQIVRPPQLPPPTRPGVRPEETQAYVQIAKEDAGVAAQVQETLAETGFHAELPALSEEFLNGTPMAGRTVYVDPQAILKAYSEGHTVLPQFSLEIGAALETGRDVAIPETAFHADLAGKPYAEAINAATRFREDGISLDEAEGLPQARAGGETPTEAVPTTPTPQRAPVPEDVAEALPRELPALVDESVEEVFAELSLKSLFAEPKAAGLTKPQFERYDVQLAEAKAAASERLLKRTYDQIRRERTPEWADTIARTAAVVEDELSTNRAVSALRELQYNEGPRGEPLERPGLKLNREAVADAFGRATVDALPRSVFAVDGGHLDDVGEALGYDTGQELLSDLLDLNAQREASGHNNTREMLRAAVRTEAESRARAALGYDVSREGLMAAAREAAILPAIEDFLEENLRAIAEELGLPFQKGQVEAIAKAQFDTLPVREAVNVRAFEKGMWKTGNKTQIALEKGDWPAAFIGRQQQLINFHQLKAAHFLARKVGQAQKKFRYLARKDTIRGLSQPVLDQLHTYLPQFGFPTKREPQELAEALNGVTLEDFVAEIIATDAAFLGVPEVEPAPLTDLIVDDFWKVRGFVYGMNRYGRELQTALKDEKRVAREEVIEAALASVPPKKPPQGPPPAHPIDPKKSLRENILSGLKVYDAMHRKSPDLVEWMDRGNPLGVWAQNITLPMYEAANVESSLHRTAYDPVIRAWNAVPDAVKRGYNTKLATGFNANGRPLQVYRRNILHMALYAGTPESLRKAAEGFGVPEDDYLAVVNAHITPEEVAVVEAVWDGFEELAPRVSEALRALTGQGLRRVETAPVRIGGRTLRGGYVPLEYNRDPQLNPSVLEWEREREAQISPDGLDQLFGEVLPNKGFSEERTNYVGPVNVEISGLARMFNAHIKYAAFARPVSDVRKFVYEPRIAAAIETTFGSEYINVLPAWLDGVVRPYQPNEKFQEGVDRFIEGIGRNMTVGALVFSYGTLVSQAAGFANGVAVLSDGNALRGLTAMLGGYRDAIGALTTDRFHSVFEKSEFMRHRYGALEQNMTEALMEADDLAVRVGVGKALRHLERVGFQTIGWVEFATVSGPTWLAAERKALEAGATPERAVQFADRMVTKSQGGGRRVDMAAVQRFRGVLKLMYAFQSFFNQQYQLTIDIYRNVAGGSGPPPEGPPPEMEIGPDGEPDVPRMARYSHAQAAILFVAVLILNGVLDNILRKKKQSVLDPFFNVLRPLIGLNTMANFLQRHFAIEGGKFVFKNPQDTKFGDDLLTRTGEIVAGNVLNLAKAAQGKKVSRPVQTAAGLAQIARVPGAAQIGRTGEYLYELQTGQQRPREGREWTDIYAGLTGGPKPEQKVQQRRTRRRRSRR